MAINSLRSKVVLLGEGRVGKTSICLRYIHGEYDDRQVPTIQASFLDKKISVDGSNLHLSIWDTAGQEKFHSLAPIYYRDADIAIIVYDVTDLTSFEKVKTWVKELKKIVGNSALTVIVGNKIDDTKNRCVQERDAVE
jgi:Ras-related protein Rab-21